MFHYFVSRFGKKSMGWILAISLLLTLVITPTVAYIVVRTSSLLNTFVSGLDPEGDLVIRKVVAHPFGDDYVIPDHIGFHFRIDLGLSYAEKELNTSKGAMTADENGSVVIHINAGESAGIHGLIAGTSVTVTEIQQEGDGFTVFEDIDQKTVTISAKEDNVVTFLNIYDPEPVDPVNLKVEGIKNLEGREWQEGDCFTFRLEYRNSDADGEWKEIDTQSVLYEIVEVQDPDFPDDPLKTISIVKPDFNRFDFSELISSLHFEKFGTYAFRISEIEGSIAGITYDNNISYFDVVVGDADMDGKLEIQHVTGTSNTTISFDEESGNHTVLINFNNRYAPEGSAEAIIEIFKKLEDKSGQNKTPAGFVFELYDAKGNLITTSEPTTSAGETAIKLVFTAEQAGMTFPYVLKEQNSGEVINGIIYDDTEYRFFISVIDNLDGSIRAVIYEDTVSDEDGNLHSVTEPIEIETEPTEETEPETEPTDVPAEPTEPTTVPTEPVTEPTEPTTVPTEPTTEPTEPTTVSTEPVTEPTEPITVPTEPVTEPTEPDTVPTEPVTEPTEPVTEPTGETTAYAGGAVRNPIIRYSATVRTGEHRLTVTSVSQKGSTESDSDAEQTNDALSGTEPHPTEETAPEIDDTEPSEPSEDTASDVVSSIESTESGNPSAEKEADQTPTIGEQISSEPQVQRNCYGAEIPADASNTYAVHFENIYEPGAAAVQFSGEKKLNGRKLKDQEFSFELYRTDSGFAIDDHAVLLQTVKNNVDGRFAFDKISFYTIGSYYYVVRENRDHILAGVTYDTIQYLITVSVSDQNGVLQASYTITDSFGTKSSIVFRNDYTPAAVSVPLTATKILNGKDLGNGMFRFLLYRANENYAADGNPIDKVSNDSQGVIVFKDLQFSKPGVYYFIVREDLNHKLDHVSYDHSVYGVKVVVTDNNEGILVPTMEIQLLGDGIVDKIVFSNTYIEPETTVPTEPDTQPTETTDSTVPTTRPPKPDGPPTGDTTDIGLHLMIALISAFALIILWDMRRCGILKKR